MDRWKGAAALSWLARCLLVVLLSLMMVVCAGGVCTGTLFARVQGELGIVAIPKMDLFSASKYGRLWVPGTQEADSGITSVEDVLCWLVVPDRLQCLNITSGEMGESTLSQNLTSSSRLFLSPTLAFILVNTANSTIVLYTFEFYNNSLQLDTLSKVILGTQKLNFAVVFSSHGFNLAGSSEGDNYVTEYDGGYILRTSIHVPAPEIPIEWVSFNQSFSFRTSTDHLYSYASAAFQYSMHTTNISTMISTVDSCPAFLVVAGPSVYFLTPNTTELEEPLWVEYYTYDYNPTFLSTSWSTYDYFTAATPSNSIVFPISSTVPYISDPGNPPGGPLNPNNIICPGSSPEPRDMFYCDPDLKKWTTITSSLSSDTIRLSTEVLVPGTLSISGEIGFVGLNSLLNVTGCVLNIGSIRLSLNASEYALLRDSETKTRQLVVSSCSTDALATVPMTLVSEYRNCERATIRATPSLNTLGAILTVDTKRCRTWWIALSAALAAIFLIGLLILIIGLSRSSRKCLFPSHDIDQGAANPPTKSVSISTLPSSRSIVLPPLTPMHFYQEDALEEASEGTERDEVSYAYSSEEIGSSVDG